MLYSKDPASIQVPEYIHNGLEWLENKLLERQQEVSSDAMRKRRSAGERCEMMEIPAAQTDDLFDAEADKLIAKCVAADPPISFFLFAGAGSGKTRSLIQALQVIKETVGARLRLNGRRVGVITFTNKACDEIKRRLEYDDLFAVSTIHSFAWSLIKGLNHDIREWLKSKSAD